MAMQDQILFSEVQRFRQKWLWAVIIILAGADVGLFLVGLIQQVFLGQPFGSKPVPNGALISITSFNLVFVGVLVWLFYYAKMITEVRADGLYVRFVPIQQTFLKIPLYNIASMKFAAYPRFMLGIHYSKKKTMYNMANTGGVELLYNDGHAFLLGTREPDELTKAIRQIMTEKQ